jgi:hypothetical protein
VARAASSARTGAGPRTTGTTERQGRRGRRRSRPPSSRASSPRREASSRPNTSTSRHAAQKRRAEPQLPPQAPLERALRYLAARASRWTSRTSSLPMRSPRRTRATTRAWNAPSRELVTLAHEEGAGSYWALETNTPFYGWGLAGRIETTALAVKALNRYCAKRRGMRSTRILAGRAVVSAIEARKPRPRSSCCATKTATASGIRRRRPSTSSTRSRVSSQAAAPLRGGTAEIFVNGRRAGALDAAALVSSQARSRSTSRPSSARATTASKSNARLLRARAGAGSHDLLRALGEQAGDVRPRPRTCETAKGETREEETASRRLRVAALLRGLSVFGYDRPPPRRVNQEVTCSVVGRARRRTQGYGMMLAEVGLPPGADVDRASLERAMRESGWTLNSYDVLPDRLVLYLWPAGGGTRFQLQVPPALRPRRAHSALDSSTTTTTPRRTPSSRLRASWYDERQGGRMKDELKAIQHHLSSFRLHPSLRRFAMRLTEMVSCAG